MRGRMALTVKMYPARNGDAFLVTAEDDVPIAVLVDGGYHSTVREHVIPDLRDLAGRGREIDLAVATHVDADHVSGLLRLFEANGHASAPQVIRIREVWHNSLRSIRKLLGPNPTADVLGPITD